ncbi:MAG: hypothetical protein JJE47_06105 [Acidimicrobiia bacterium]|nr:hypothetical protein [Acidimicrobiia bacterium]
MRRGTDTPPTLTGGLQMVAAITTAVGAAFSSGATDRQLLVGLGLLLITTVGLVGLFLARGKWARRFLWAPLAVESAMFVVFDTGWIPLAFTALAGVALGLPSLDGWVRQLRKAVAPPNAAVLLPLTLLGSSAVIGLLREPGLWDWAFCTTTVVVAWSYGRAHLATLWSLRMIYPVLGLLVAFSVPGWPSLAIAAFVTVCSALAWSPGALRAVRPLEARRVDARPVFAEMTPPGLMEEIGRDRHGRKHP